MIHMSFCYFYKLEEILEAKNNAVNILDCDKINFYCQSNPPLQDIVMFVIIQAIQGAM